MGLTKSEQNDTKLAHSTANTGLVGILGGTFFASLGAIGHGNLESGFHPNLTENIGYGVLATTSVLVFASAAYIMFREIYRESQQR